MVRSIRIYNIKLFSLDHLQHYTLKNTASYIQWAKVTSLTVLFPELHLLWKEGILSEQHSFSFFLAFSQSTEDQVHLGSVTQGRGQCHLTPHIPPIPSGVSFLLGTKHRERQSRHHVQALSHETGQAGLRHTGFCPSFFILWLQTSSLGSYPTPSTKELIYN